MLCHASTACAWNWHQACGLTDKCRLTHMMRGMGTQLASMASLDRQVVWLRGPSINHSAPLMPTTSSFTSGGSCPQGRRLVSVCHRNSASYSPAISLSTPLSDSKHYNNGPFCLSLFPDPINHFIAALPRRSSCISSHFYKASTS